MAWSMYSEHEGVNLQVLGKTGYMIALYIQTIHREMLYTALCLECIKVACKNFFEPPGCRFEGNDPDRPGRPRTTNHEKLPHPAFNVVALHRVVLPLFQAKNKCWRRNLGLVDSERKILC